MRFSGLDRSGKDSRKRLESSVSFSPNSTHIAISLGAGRLDCLTQGFYFTTVAELAGAPLLAL